MVGKVRWEGRDGCNPVWFDQADQADLEAASVEDEVLSERRGDGVGLGVDDVGQEPWRERIEKTIRKRTLGRKARERRTWKLAVVNEFRQVRKRVIEVVVASHCRRCTGQRR